MSALTAQKIFTKTAVIIPLAVICTLLWGSAFACIKIGYGMFQIAENDIPTKLVFAGVRFTAAGLLTILIASLAGRRPAMPTRKNIGGITLLGLVMTTFQYVFFYIGVANTQGVKGSILNATSTFLAVLLAHFFYKYDRLTIHKLLGCVVGFSGVVLVNLGGGPMDTGFKLMGEGCIIMASLTFGVGTLISKEVSMLGEPMTVTGWQLLIGGVALTVLGVGFGGALTVITPAGLAMLGYLALLSAVAFSGWTALLKYNPMGKISIYNFLTPVFGVLLSALLLREGFLSWRVLLALALVCVGIVAVNYHKNDKTVTNPNK